MAEEVDADDVFLSDTEDAADEGGDGGLGLGPSAQVGPRQGRLQPAGPAATCSHVGAYGAPPAAPAINGHRVPPHPPPPGQVLTIGCWSSSREASLLLAALARVLPLGDAGAPLESAQLRSAGDRLLALLLALKHNGAVDRARAAFLALCQRLLAAPEPGLAALPAGWLRDALAFLRRPGQGRSDIVRRSAGLPAALTALFEAEPEGGARGLMAAGMAALLALAAPGAAAGAGSEASAGRGAGGAAPAAVEGAAADQWPRVHAFNSLRMAFQNSSLAVDATAFVAPGALQAAAAAVLLDSLVQLP